MTSRSRVMVSRSRWADAQDGAARGLIDAAGLHADKAVLHHIQTADAVGPAQGD